MFLIQKPYKEEWESDKQVIYFPVHITQEYEAQTGVKKATADVTLFYFTLNAVSFYSHQKSFLIFTFQTGTL